MPAYDVNLKNPKLLVGGKAETTDADPINVYVKPVWGNTWTLNNDIIPRRIEYVPGDSGLGSGQFLYRYGPRIGASNLTVTDWERWYIKVEFGSHVWVGQIQAQASDLHGGNQNTPTGAKTIVASSLESLFHHNFVFESAFVDDDRGSIYGTAKEGFTFNDLNRPNKSGATHPGDLLYFSNEANAEHWSTRSIVKYALQNWVPQNSAQTAQEMTIELDAADEARLPDWDRPILVTHGYRPIEILNRIINRRRLLMWFLEIDENQNPAVLKFRVATMTDSVVGTPPNQIVANDQLFRLSTDENSRTTVVVEQDNNSQIDKLVVQGAKRRTVFSVAFKANAALHVGEAKWANTLEIDYESGGSGEANYPAATEVGERRAFHTKYRQRPKFRDVFARFGLDLTEALPHNDPDSHEAPSFAIKILPTLPLLENRDYTGSAIAGGEVWDAGIGEPEMQLLAFLEITNAEFGSAQAVYVDASKLGRSSDVPPKAATDKYDFSCNVRAVDNDASFRLEVDGDNQEVLSSAPIMVPVDTHGVFEQRAEDKLIGNIDWRDMVATVAVEDDRYCEAEVTISPVTGAYREFRINAGENYRVDYVVSGAAVDVDLNTGALLTSDGGYFRDDRPRLQEIANRAGEYYGKPRGILRLNFDFHDVDVFDQGTSNPAAVWPFRLGHFIQSVRNSSNGGSPIYHTVGSAISSITMDFPVVESDTPIPRVGVPQLTVVTAYGNLDPEFFLPARP